MKALDSLRAEYPELPADYFSYLMSVGHGEAPSGRMIYSGPIDPSDVYGERLKNSRIVLLGDDMMGYCLGFDRDSRRLGEVSPRGEWESWPPERTFTSYTKNHDEQPQA